MRRRAESELCNSAERFLKKKGFDRQKKELQFYEYNIDIYGFSQFSDLTISIELKIENWRRAFEQALVYQLCSDLVFMALPKENVHRVDQNLLNSEGIGLLSIGLNNQCYMKIAPRKSIVINDSYKQQNIELLRQMEKD